MLEHALDPGPNAAADFVLDACTFRGQSATIGSPAARRPGAEGGRRGVEAGSRRCRFLFAQIRLRLLLSRRHLQPRRSFATGLPRGPRNGRPPLNTGVPRLSSHVTTRPDWGNRAARPRATERTRTGECATVLGARDRWRNGRQPTRPVLKHGPRSLTCARVKGLDETQRRNESETEAGALGEFALRVARSPTRGWDPRRRFIAAARGAPPARLDRTRR